MSVLIETTKGDLVIDLFVKDAPKACLNFLKLCKTKYYNFGLIYNVQKDFSFQAGDPLYPLGNGGSSIWGLCGDSRQRAFQPEFSTTLNHAKVGTVSAITTQSSRDQDKRLATSQFVVTLAPDQDQLDGRAAVFGQVVEGLETLEAINKTFCDEDHRPLQDIRIKHTYLLEDPFEDPKGLREPSKSPEPTEKQLATVRLDDDQGEETNSQKEDEDDEEARETRRREQEARAQALTLEMVGDLPYAEVKPPENVLFVCKLNPVTQSEDLELIFSRFGKILSCEVIKDSRTGESLQYAFIEFEDKRACQQAYFKMQDVLIDDSRIHVDFSQSVAKLSNQWHRSHRPPQSNHNNNSNSSSNTSYRRYKSPPRHRRDTRPRSPSPDDARYSKHRSYRDRDRRYDQSRHRDRRRDGDYHRHYQSSM